MKAAECAGAIEELKTFDLDTIAVLFDYLARRTPPDFAMKCGYACSIKDFGIVGFAMMSMPTLRDAFQHYIQFGLLLGHPVFSTITEEGDRWRMDFVPRHLMSPDALRFCLEASIAAVEPVIAEMTDAPANTLRIDLSFERPLSTERYDLFGTGHIRYGCHATAYIGRRSDLDRPIRSRNGDLSDIFHQQSDKFLAELMHARSIRDKLEDYLVASAGKLPSLDDMAKALRMSRRSLQRDLRRENLTYQQVVKEFRMRQAMLLLGEDRMNIKTIAYLLGYRDVSSFRRAFQDWTGQSVGQWQASKARAGSPAGRASAPVEHQLHMA